MTAQQISKELRGLRLDPTYFRASEQKLNQLADAIDALPNQSDETYGKWVTQSQPNPISKSVQESAQRAADEIYQPTERLGLLAHAQRINEISEIILSHLAPHCGVNQEMKKCLWLMLDGTRPDYSDSLTAISSRQTEINRAWKAYEAAEAVQTQPASLDSKPKSL